MGFEELKVLPDVFERVCKRTEDGEKFTKDLIKYLEKRSKAEVTYSKTLQHVNSELFKVEQELGSMKDTWNSLKTESEAIAQGHENFSNKINELIESLKSAHMEERKNRALLVAKGSKLLKDLAASESTMKKARANYVDLRKTQDKAQTAVEKAKQTGDPKKESAAQKQYEKDENKAEKADNEYRITVNTHKAAQDQYYDSDLPALLKEFEAYEKRRSETTRNFFEQFVSLQEAIGPHTKDATERLRKKISAINARSDLDLFVSQQDAKSLPQPARAVYVSYDGSEGGSSSAPAPSSATSAPKPAAAAPAAAPAADDKKKKGGIGGMLGGLGGLGKRSSAKPEEKKSIEPAKPAQPEKKSGVQFESSGPKIKEQPAASSATSTPAAAPAASLTSSATSSAVKKEETKPAEESKPAGEGVVPAIEGGLNEDVVALYDYEATEEGELTFNEGDRITLIEKDESGWWKGRTVAGKVGVFPSNFVEVIGAEAAAPSGGNAIEINSDYRALYDYDAEDDTELTIKEGDILHVASETDGWYFGTRKSDGKQGNFPSNFVEPV